MKKKLKKIFILFILIIIIAIIVFIFLNRKKKVIVNDYTLSKSSTSSLNNNSSGSDRKIETEDVKAVVNKYIKIPTEDEANKINAGITGISSINNGLRFTMDSVAREVFDSYGKGDIFILNGDENTPLKEIYFGKIVNKYVNSNGELIVETENPTIDEIFDELKVDSSGLLTEENVKKVQLAEGVDLQWVDNFDSEFATTPNIEENTYTIGNEDIIEPVENITLETKGSFLLNVNVGTKYDFNNKKWTTTTALDVKDKVDGTLKINEAELTSSSENTQYKDSKEIVEGPNNETKTTTEYLNDDGYEKVENEVKEDYSKYTKVEEDYKENSKTTTTISEYYLDKSGNRVDSQGNRIDADGNRLDENGNKIDKNADLSTFEKTLKTSGEYEETVEFSLTGKVGFEDIGAKANIDFSIWDDNHIKDLSFGVGGKAVASLESKALFNAEVGGKTTKLEVPNTVKLTGLDNRMLPLGYISFTGVVIPFGGVNEYLNNAFLDAGIMLYSDLYGKVSMTLSSKLDYSYGFEATNTLFKNGEFVNKSELKTTEDIKIETSFIASATIRFDLIGFGGIFTFSNITVAEIDVVDFYLDLQAQVVFKLTTGRSKTVDYSKLNEKSDDEWKTDVKFEMYGYGGLYVDIGIIKINFQLTLFPNTRLSNTYGIQGEWTLLTLEIFKYGSDNNPTGKTEDYTFGSISAITPDYEIYRDSKGKLVRREIKSGSIASYEVPDFVTICGIDQSYIYLLRDDGEDSYNLCRVKIKGEANHAKVIEDDVTNMIIARNVDDVLLEDDEYIYFTEKDDISTLKRINRSTRKITIFCTLDNMKYIKINDEPENDRLYIAVNDYTDRISAIFGEYPNYYYYFNKQTGTEISEAPETYEYKNDDGYVTTSKILVRKFLRNTVDGQSVNIISTNGTNIHMDTTIGWNGSKIGEFVIHDEEKVDADGNTKNIKKLGYYNKNTAEFIGVAEVNDEYALWTTIVGSDNRIYYIDENEETNEKELLSVDINGNDKKVVKVFDKDEFNVDMNNTGSENMNSTIIFYSYNDDNIEVKYRYDIEK